MERVSQPSRPFTNSILAKLPTYQHGHGGVVLSYTYGLERTGRSFYKLWHRSAPVTCLSHTSPLADTRLLVQLGLG
jgi:hypothetical protein